MKKILLVNSTQGFLSGFVEHVRHQRRDAQITEFVMPRIPRRWYLPQGILGELLAQIIYVGIFLFKVRRIAAGNDAIVLNGNGVAPAFMVYYSLARLINPKLNVIIIHYFLNNMRTNRVVMGAVRFLFNKEGMSLIALTTEDQDYFSRLAPQANISFHPLCLYDYKVGVAGEAINEEPYIFAGGATNRDYETLMRAATLIKARFIVIAGKSNNVGDVPENVTLLRSINKDKFTQYLAQSRFVVIPLKSTVGSSGHMVALSAMAFGKAIAYTDASCLNDYFDDSSGLRFKRGDHKDLQATIERLMADDAQVKILGANAKRRFESYLKEDFFYDYLARQCLR